MKTIYLAGGCFWGVENYFQNLKGVLDTEVGYANSEVANPTYEMVCTGKTFSTECVRVKYDEKILTLDKILYYFFELIDPTVINRQGNDIGTQYRTGIYFEKSEKISGDDLEKNLEKNLENSLEERIKKQISEIQEEYKEKIVTEVQPLNNFFEAEEYHQDYLIKNPNGYCHCLSEIETLKKSKDAKVV